MQSEKQATAVNMEKRSKEEEQRVGKREREQWATGVYRVFVGGEGSRAR
jgi:hypothetical protein